MPFSGWHVPLQYIPEAHLPSKPSQGVPSTRRLTWAQFPLEQTPTRPSAPRQAASNVQLAPGPNVAVNTAAQVAVSALVSSTLGTTQPAYAPTDASAQRWAASALNSIPLVVALRALSSQLERCVSTHDPVEILQHPARSAQTLSATFRQNASGVIPVTGPGSFASLLHAALAAHASSS